MKLKDILYKVAIEAVHGSTDVEVNAIHFDSRKIESNDVFVAIKGTVSDGHNFIDKAIGLRSFCSCLRRLASYNFTSNYLRYRFKMLMKL